MRVTTSPQKNSDTPIFCPAPLTKWQWIWPIWDESNGQATEVAMRRVRCEMTVQVKYITNAKLLTRNGEWSLLVFTSSKYHKKLLKSLDGWTKLTSTVLPSIFPTGTSVSLSFWAECSFFDSVWLAYLIPPTQDSICHLGLIVGCGRDVVQTKPPCLMMNLWSIPTNILEKGIKTAWGPTHAIYFTFCKSTSQCSRQHKQL